MLRNKLIQLCTCLALLCSVSQAQDLLDTFDWSNAQYYCRVEVQTTDTDAITGLCIQELNLFEFSGFRVGVALEERLPSFRTTPLLLFDYTQELWFVGVELGYALIDDEALRVALTFGGSFPSTQETVETQ